MTVDFAEGFDLGAILAGVSMTATVTGSGAITYPTGRTASGKCLRLASTSNTSHQADLFASVAARSSGQVAFALRTNYVATASNEAVINLREGTTDHIRVHIIANNLINVSRAGTTLATSGPILMGTWNHFDLTYVIHSTAGSFSLRLNGQEILAQTNINTRNGGNGVIDNYFSRIINSGQNGVYREFDDFYSTTLNAPNAGSQGDCVIEALLPTGTGDLSDFVGSDGNSVDNWALVDDVSITDYVGASAVGATDLYVMADGRADLGDVLAVVPRLLAAKNDSGTPNGNLAAAVRVGGTTTDVVTNPIANLTTTATGSDVGVLDRQPDGSAWTLAALNAMQVGPRIKAV